LQSLLSKLPAKPPLWVYSCPSFLLKMLMFVDFNLYRVFFQNNRSIVRKWGSMVIGVPF
jgi:hypothetical protein